MDNVDHKGLDLAVHRNSGRLGCRHCRYLLLQIQKHEAG